jgi:hypothetical protein
MFNIRKENLENWIVPLMYSLLLGVIPIAVANASDGSGDVVPVVEQEVKVNPLDKFKGAVTLSDSDLVELLRAVGFEGKALKVAYAVAKKESNGRPLAHNGNVNTGDNSYGIFQINMLGSLGEDRREKFQLKTNKDLLEPVTNAKIAYHMSNGGENWSAWKVYPGQKNGERYESFLREFPN